MLAQKTLNTFTLNFRLEVSLNIHFGIFTSPALFLSLYYGAKKEK